MNLDRTWDTPSDRTYTGMIVRALFDGGVFGIMAPAVYAVAAPLWSPELAVTFSNPPSLMVVSIFAALGTAFVEFVLALCFMGPLASFLASIPYERGVKSYAVYMAIGAAVGLATALAIAFLISATAADSGKTLSQLLQPSFLLWIVSSSGYGGWSFADQLNRKASPTAG